MKAEKTEFDVILFTSISLPEGPEKKRKKKWNLQTLEHTNSEKKMRDRLQKMQTREPIRQLYRLYGRARIVKQTPQKDVKIFHWKTLRIKRVHLAYLLRSPHVLQQMDIKLKLRTRHWIMHLELGFPNNKKLQKQQQCQLLFHCQAFFLLYHFLQQFGPARIWSLSSWCVRCKRCIRQWFNRVL